MTGRNLTHAEMSRTGTRLINRRTLLSMIPLSERTIFNMEKRGEFPQRIALTSRNVAWLLQEVEEWIAERKASGDKLRPPGQREQDKPD